MLVGVSPWRVLAKTGWSGKKQEKAGEQINYGGRRESRGGFKARKKLITRKRECFTRMGMNRSDDYGRVVFVRSKGS